MTARRLLLTAALTTVLGAQAGAATAKPLRCATLKGTDLAPDPGVRLVVRKSGGAPTYLSCRGRKGTPRVVATTDGDDDIGSEGLSLGAVHGVWAQFDRTSSDQYAYTQTTQLVDLLTGHGYDAFSFTDPTGSSSSGPPPSLTTLLFDGAGRSVALVGDVTPDPGGSTSTTSLTLTLRAPDGTAFVVDSGPGGSITDVSLDAKGIAWTRDGAPRSVGFG